MKLLLNKITSFFISFFRIIEENQHINYITSIGKENNGLTVVFAKPLTSEGAIKLYPHMILSENYLKSQFRQSDIKLLEAIIVTEGDIFVDEVSYEENSDQIHLRSILSGEKWHCLTDEIKSNKDLANRINIRFANKIHTN